MPLMRRPGGLMRAAATASMVSTARTNRARRQAIQAETQEVQNQSAATQTQAAQSTDVPTAELEKLADLKDKGIITQEEFDAKKKQLLGI